MRHLCSLDWPWPAVLAAALTHAQAPTPFKLGTFERDGRPFVGIVLRESVVIDFAAAHAAIRTPASTVAAPADMKDLIVRYDAGLRARIGDIVRSVEAAGAARPAYAYELRAVKILPPIMYPTTMLNVAVNYREHDLEMAKLREQVPGMGGADVRRRAAEHRERARHLGARGRRQALESVRVHEVAGGHHRRWRGDPSSAGTHAG